jgi:hypothetical protein
MAAVPGKLLDGEADAEDGIDARQPAPPGWAVVARQPARGEPREQGWNVTGTEANCIVAPGIDRVAGPGGRGPEFEDRAASALPHSGTVRARRQREAERGEDRCLRRRVGRACDHAVHFIAPAGIALDVRVVVRAAPLAVVAHVGLDRQQRDEAAAVLRMDVPGLARVDVLHAAHHALALARELSLDRFLILAFQRRTDHVEAGTELAQEPGARVLVVHRAEQLEEGVVAERVDRVVVGQPFGRQRAEERVHPVRALVEVVDDECRLLDGVRCQFGQGGLSFGKDKL